MTRYIVDHIIQSTRTGNRSTEGEQMAAYLRNPRGYHPAAPSGAYKFHVPSSANPTFRKISGTPLTSSGQSGKLIFTGGKREGICIDLNRRKMGKTPGSDFAPGKYVTEPHPFFLLSTSALPPGSSDSLIAQARESFSCSIARNTQNSYATAVRHLKSAEQDLGCAISVPMSEE